MTLILTHYPFPNLPNTNPNPNPNSNPNPNPHHYTNPNSNPYPSPNPNEILTLTLIQSLTLTPILTPTLTPTLQKPITFFNISDSLLSLQEDMMVVSIWMERQAKTTHDRPKHPNTCLSSKWLFWFWAMSWLFPAS